MVRTRVLCRGVAYHTVGGAAKMLRTNTTTVKKLMGAGDLEWLNFNSNGRLYISEVSILTYQRKLQEQKRLKHASLKQHG